MSSPPPEKGSSPTADEVAAGEAEAPSGNGGKPAEAVEETGEGRALPASEEIASSIAPVVGPDDERIFTDSGIEIEPLYEEGDVAAGLPERLGEPGAYPF